MEQNHEYFMKKALEEAEKALNSEEVPVGCVFVFEGKVIAAAANETNNSFNATRHAELVAIDKILLGSNGKFTANIFPKCTLYVTVEPCIMCAAALGLINIGKVIFGCHNDRFGGCGSILNLNETNAHRSELYTGYPISDGLLRSEAISLLRRFYEGGNPRVCEAKRKRDLN